MKILVSILLLLGFANGISVPCQINLDARVGDDLPMILNKDNTIIYPEDGSRILTIADQSNIALFCHGTAKRSSEVDIAKLPALEKSKSYVPLICKGGKFYYTLNQKFVNISNPVCNARQQPEMSKTYQKCSSVGADGRTQDLDQLFTAQIAWNISGKWTEQIQVCADDKVYGTLWVKYTIRGMSIVQRDLTPGRPVFRTDTTDYKRFFDKTTTTSVTGAYTKTSQVTMMNTLLNTNNLLIGTDQNIIDGSTGSNYFARGHLAPDADFIYDVEQDATYYFMNVAPQFQSFNNGNWKSLEIAFRKYADSKKQNVIAYTGTLGNLAYKNKSGILTPIYLLNINGLNYLPAPKYFWKLMYNPQLFEAVLFIGLNNPYGETSELNFCNSVCSQLSWILADPNSVQKGAFQCCELNPTLLTKIANVPNLSDENNNWPSLITSL